MTNTLTKRQRFEKLAIYRTNNILRGLRILGNCANRAAYEYTEEDIKKIFRAIEEKVAETKMKFRFNKKEDNKFKL
jgi:hypothetical protein